jgi:hypothetical protein
MFLTHGYCQKDALNALAEAAWQCLPPGTGVKFVARRHEVIFQPPPVRFLFRLDYPAPTAQAIDGSVAQGGRERSLIQPLKCGCIQSGAEVKPRRTACKFAGERLRRKACQFIQVVLTSRHFVALITLSKVQQGNKELS